MPKVVIAALSRPAQTIAEPTGGPRLWRALAPSETRQIAAGFEATPRGPAQFQWRQCHPTLSIATRNLRPARCGPLASASGRLIGRPLQLSRPASVSRAPIGWAQSARPISALAFIRLPDEQLQRADHRLAELTGAGVHFHVIVLRVPESRQSNRAQVRALAIKRTLFYETGVGSRG